MAEDHAPARGAADQRFFLIRRLHSLAGLVPVGAYLFLHLTVNATILFGPDAYQFSVDRIHDLEKMGLLFATELLFIFIPLAFHALVGVVIWLTSTPNTTHYPSGSNVRYALQRWTGVIAFVFIMVHLWQMHWMGKPFGGGFFDAERAPETAWEAMARWWAAPLYAVGVLASVFHLANGIWTFLITWGITIGPRSQRYSGYACTAFGVILGLIGMGALYGFTLKGAQAAAKPAPATEIAAREVSGEL